MESLKELYKVGVGPSSSHTIAPQRALHLFEQQFPECTHYHIELYGSLSLTGKGHFTDLVLEQSTQKPVKVEFKLEWEYPFDTGLIIYGYQEETLIEKWVVYSLGGGSIHIVDYDVDFQKQVYFHTSLNEIKEYCQKQNISLLEYVLQHEPDILDYLEMILDTMVRCVDKGLKSEGQLLGPLNIPRVAGQLYQVFEGKKEKKIIAYAYAVMEENATIQTVVTAPTCGSAGVMAAVMTYCLRDLNMPKSKVVEALAVGGLFGNLIKRNATISGAQGGCQAEVGAACSMSAAAYAYLLDQPLCVIEYAAEVAMEHHLGLTCDPVGGYVIIPCIERNGVAALRSLDATEVAIALSQIKQNKVSFDQVISTMNYTGQKLAIELKETSLGGLAKENIIY